MTAVRLRNRRKRFALRAYHSLPRDIDVIGVRIISGIKQFAKCAEGYKKGGQIINLCKTYRDCPLMLRGLFIKSDVAKTIVIQEGSHFNSLQFLSELLLAKENYGKAPIEANITLNDAPEETLFSPSEFFNQVAEMQAVCDMVRKQKNYMPAFVQRIIAVNICRLMESLEDIMDVYDRPEYNYYKKWKRFSALLQNIQDAILMELVATKFKKLFLLNMKYNRKPQFSQYNDDLCIMYENTVPYNVSGFISRIELIKISGGKLLIEGNCHVPAGISDDEFYNYALINGKRQKITQVDRLADRYFFEKVYLSEKGFQIEIPLIENEYKIQLYNHIAGYDCIKKNIEFMSMCPIGKELTNSYYYNDGYAVTTDGVNIYCQKYSPEARQNREMQLQDEIRKVAGKKSKEIIALRNYYWDNVNNKNKQIWLITDRPDRADDNGEAFFRHMQSHNYSGIESYFVLRHDSEKYKELKDIGTIIEPYSVEHKQLHLLADYVISSQMSETANNPFDRDYIFFRDLYRRNKFIFLQHGVIHNHHGRVLGKYNRDFYGLITSAKREMEYLASPRFHYGQNVVWLTGLTRFDQLYHDEKNIITIMPTWRKYLTTREFDPKLGTLAWVVKEDFIESEYFRFFDALINDERLLNAADNYGYKICFMPHVQFLKQTEHFHRDERVEIYQYEKSYREIYAESNLIVTDYSSAVFDFAYLYKPVLYCQFDEKDFWTRHTVKKGYWNFERDGFGEVVYDLNSLVNTMIQYMQSGCALKDKYRKRIQNFFAFTDNKCCERLVEKIQEKELSV